MLQDGTYRRLLLREARHGGYQNNIDLLVGFQQIEQQPSGALVDVGLVDQCRGRDCYPLATLQALAETRKRRLGPSDSPDGPQRLVGSLLNQHALDPRKHESAVELLPVGLVGVLKQAVATSRVATRACQGLPDLPQKRAHRDGFAYSAYEPRPARHRVMEHDIGAGAG